MGTNREFAMNEFPASDQLWERYKKANEITDEQSYMSAVPYYQGADGFILPYVARCRVRKIFV